jgi:hypothetical protein
MSVILAAGPLDGGWYGLVSRHEGTVWLVEPDAMGSLPAKKPQEHYSKEELQPLITKGQARSFDSGTIHRLLQVLEQSTLH